jgi:hypothetical protein
MTKFHATLPTRESRAVVWVWRVLLVVACVHSVLFCWSIYRRIWQVLRIEVRAPSTVIGPGSLVGYDVVTTGEVRNVIRLELIQGAHTEILEERRGRLSVISAYDPRVFRETALIPVPAATLARFQPGPATLRVLGFGGMKLLRTPTTKAKELQVTLVPRR